MPAPFSRGLSAFAPITNRQGLSSSMSMPRPMARPAPAPRPAPMPRRPTQTFARPRPGAMPMPQQAQNPFAGFQQPMPAPQPMLPPQPFNSYPNPTAGAGAGQIPMGKQMAPQFNPQMLPQVEPYDPGQIQQPKPMTGGFDPIPNPALNPDIMFGPDANGVVGTGRPVPQQGPAGLLQKPSMDDLMFGPDANGVVGTGRPVGGGSLFNPGAFKMK